MVKIDYDKYTDKAMRQKPIHKMDDMERQYYDAVTAEEANKILARLHNVYGAQFAKSVSLRLAVDALKDQKDEEDGSDNLL
jgi:hypothetical protein